MIYFTYITTLEIFSIAQDRLKSNIKKQQRQLGNVGLEMSTLHSLGPVPWKHVSTSLIFYTEWSLNIAILSRINF